ncbi:Eukaryotic/viral aspartic protease [Phytophthora megakarya]|uniref:Eukaryotic/viral aspartic protease n=1 Tax=Phytophthora megakarya TaxID=4795 RepID=A0A225VTX7_9STRA|nr:Eukaryotic/viral aspartic protease [Phytophthora megakarya]
MSFLKRLDLSSRPDSHHSNSVRALNRSPSTIPVSDIKRLIPSPFTWKHTRADIRELVLDGTAFCDAVKAAGRSTLLHSRFGKEALYPMLRSVIYWQQLNFTPWVQSVQMDIWIML